MMPYRYIFGLRDRQIVCHFHFVAWSHWSLGFHLDAASPNIEMHVPFGFVRIGWQGIYDSNQMRCRIYGKRWVDKDDQFSR